MTDQRPDFILGLSFIATAGHAEGWRLSVLDNHKERFTYYLDVSRLIEDAQFHFLFLGDAISGAVNISRGWTPSPEPLLISTALATHTSTLGFVASASSLYNDPFTLARAFGTLDHISEGRAGWNNLTSFYPETANRAFAIGRELTAENKYDAAEEFLRIIRALWRTWEPEALLRDKESGFYVDPTKVHPLNFRGTYFDVAGAPNVTRSPQTEPVIFQPVSTPAGQAYAARNAEVVFNRQNNLEEAKEFYRSTKELTRAAGRTADSIAITPGLIVVVGETAADAKRQLDQVKPFIDADSAKAQLAASLGWGDQLVPDESRADAWPSRDGLPTGRARQLFDRARSGNLTFGELAYEASSARDFAFFHGTVEQVADEIEQWYDEKAVDGFVIGPIVAPDGIGPIARELTPELQRRGLFREKAPLGQTFRESLGVPGLPYDD